MCNKPFVAVLSILFIAASNIVTGEATNSQQIERDIAALVDAASRLDTAWPWQGPIPEVKRVARHGKTAGPRLVALLTVEKPMRFESIKNFHVEQQLELALCMIYKVAPESGKSVYGIRSSDEDNWTVKPFWESRLASDGNKAQHRGEPDAE